MLGGWWPGEARTGWGDKVSRCRDGGERAGGAGLDGRKGQEEVRSALAGEGTKWDSEDQEGPATRCCPLPSTVVLGRPSPDAASELASTQHLSILAEAGLQLSPQGG